MTRPRWLDVSLRDAHVYGGLGLAAWGGWSLSPAWTGVLAGLAVAAIGLFLPRRAS